MRHFDIVVLHCMLATFGFSKEQRLQRTGSYIKTFWDGPDGHCDPPQERGYRADGCSAGWRKNKTASLPHQTSENRSGCRYYQRTTLFSCPKSKSSSEGVICWKSVSTYAIHPSCAGVWLNWGECDAFCGYGTKTRLKFASPDGGKKHTSAVEHRPCEIRSCGNWTRWTGAQQCEAGKCTNTFQRHCIYNNTVAPTKFCSGKYSDDNATFETVEMPCSPDMCVTTTTTEPTTTSQKRETLATSSADLVTTTYETAQFTTPSGNSLTTAKYDATNQTTISAGNNATTAEDVLPKNITEVGVSVAITNSYSFLDERKSPPTTGDVWKGLVIGLLLSSFVYGIIFFMWRRRSKNAKKDWFSAYYDPDPNKDCKKLQNNVTETSTYPLLHDIERAQTLPLQRCPVTGNNNSPVLPNSQSINSRSNQLCNGLVEPLFSNIATANVSEDLHFADSNGAGRESVNTCYTSIESVDYEPQPDVFDDESESIDSEEGRDVLRTLKRPSPKFKRSKELSVKESKPYFLPNGKTVVGDDKIRKMSSLRRNSPDWRDLISDKSAKESYTFHARIRSKSISGSIPSLNHDVTTSGYNSSAIDESTDDERAKISGSSRLRKSAKFLSRKFSKSLSEKALHDNFRTIDGHSDGLPSPPAKLQFQFKSVSADTDIPSLDTRPFLTLRPTSRRDFSVMSCNDRFIVVEDVYSLPIDAIKPARSGSPYNGYRVPIDAISKCSEPT